MLLNRSHEMADHCPCPEWAPDISVGTPFWCDISVGTISWCDNCMGTFLGGTPVWEHSWGVHCWGDIWKGTFVWEHSARRKMGRLWQVLLMEELRDFPTPDLILGPQWKLSKQSFFSASFHTDSGAQMTNTRNQKSQNPQYFLFPSKELRTAKRWFLGLSLLQPVMGTDDVPEIAIAWGNLGNQNHLVTWTRELFTAIPE